MVELTELQIKMAEAIANNDAKAIEDIASQIVKSKGERHKAEAAILQKEAEALAGDREELILHLTKEFKKMVNKVFFDEKTHTDTTNETLEAVKATGYHMSHKKVDGIWTPSVGLDVPTIKASKTGRTSTTGKSKDEFGMSLQEIFEKYASDEDKKALADAEGNNSKQWQIKNGVKKEAIKAGLLAPVK